MYIFTLDNQVQDLFINATQCGSMCMNDTIMQYAGKIWIGNFGLVLGFFFPLPLILGEIFKFKDKGWMNRKKNNFEKRKKKKHKK